MVKSSRSIFRSGARVVFTYCMKIQAKMPMDSTPMRHSVPSTLNTVAAVRRGSRFLRRVRFWDGGGACLCSTRLP